MTRFIHDQFAKQYLKELLSPFGNVETSRDIAGEVRQIDILFAPKSQPEVEATALGLLGKIAEKPAVFEPFRSPVQSGEIRSCLGKLFDLHAEFEHEGMYRAWIQFMVNGKVQVADFVLNVIKGDGKAEASEHKH